VILGVELESASWGTNGKLGV